MARPTIYSEELAERLCAAISAGPSLRKVCGRSDMPARTTVLRWAQERAGFRDQLARAYEERGEELVEDALGEVGKLVRATRRADKEAAAAASAPPAAEGEPARAVQLVSGETVRAVGLLVDTLFKRAAQLAPKRLGPLIRHAGEDGGALPLIIRRERRDAE